MDELDRVFKNCLRSNKIKPFNDGPELVNKELNAAESDLNSAKESYNKG